MQKGKGIGSFFKGLFSFVKPLLYSGAKAGGKEAFKTGSNIITDILNKEPEQHVGAIFKIISVKQRATSKKIFKNDGVWLGFKRKRKSKNNQSRRKRRKVKDIFKDKYWSA